MRPRAHFAVISLGCRGDVVPRNLSQLCRFTWKFPRHSHIVAEQSLDGWETDYDSYTLILNNDSRRGASKSLTALDGEMLDDALRYLTCATSFPRIVDASTLLRYEKFSSGLPGKSHPYNRAFTLASTLSLLLQNCHKVQYFSNVHLFIILPNIFFGVSKSRFLVKKFSPGPWKRRIIEENALLIKFAYERYIFDAPNFK